MIFSAGVRVVNWVTLLWPKKNSIYAAFSQNQCCNICIFCDPNFELKLALVPKNDKYQVWSENWLFIPHPPWYHPVPTTHPIPLTVQQCYIRVMHIISSYSLLAFSNTSINCGNSCVLQSAHTSKTHLLISCRAPEMSKLNFIWFNFHLSSFRLKSWYHTLWQQNIFPIPIGTGSVRK